MPVRIRITEGEFPHRLEAVVIVEADVGGVAGDQPSTALFSVCLRMKNVSARRHMMWDDSTHDVKNAAHEGTGVSAAY